ncbi:hypothetical protein NP233_g401 [Leucocoprinus birnbaumii]|uniref:Protein kinase domain-containing protein n=1 Tax=Leucocoprinus birnbaumii TaxID=56174 RepID=A0AAD5W2X1_9AGAR|nr:hypothetical protein NP233_g401 [Leucocoprinus birnbaumii]
MASSPMIPLPGAKRREKTPRQVTGFIQGAHSESDTFYLIGLISLYRSSFTTSNDRKALPASRQLSLPQLTVPDQWAMASQPGQGAHSAVPSTPNESDVFATLCHLVSRVDAEDRMQEVVKKAQELAKGDLQLLVDCLSMSLDRNAAPMKCRGYVWRSLIKIASTTKVLAQNHTLGSARITREAGLSPSTYSILGDRETSVRAKVLTKIENDQSHHSQAIVSWIHISHPNIVPVYSVFLDDGQHLSLVSPEITNGNICDYMTKAPGAATFWFWYLISRTVYRTYTITDCILVSDEGRAMIANTSISSDPEDSNSLPVRYSAPEFFEEEDMQPTESSDVWSLASLSYEILSDKLPFFQFAKEVRVSGAISHGSKPIRPGVDGVDGNEINDTIWQILLMCWKFEPSERPSCLKVYQIIVGMGSQDERRTAKLIIMSDVLKSSVVDLERVKTSLMGVLGCEAASSLRVPEHLRNSLLRLIPDTNKLEAAAAVVLKLSPDETQCLADFLDLLLEDLTDWFSKELPAVRNLLSLIMMSTPIIPKRYILNGIYYDTRRPLAEGAFGKAYQGRGLGVRVNVVSGPSVKKVLLKQMPSWSHASHHNILQFYGVFLDTSGGSQQLCVVTPSWRNGNLRDYARTLPPKKRTHLLLDVVVALDHLHNKLNYVFGDSILTTDKVLVSDQGRSVLASFSTQRIFTDHWANNSTYKLRFTSPDRAKYYAAADMWSFGGVCYEVLSGKPPYYQYTEDAEIQAAISRGELPKRPKGTDESMEMIDDNMWGLIEQCCSSDWWCRPTASTAAELIANMIEAEDDRPPAEQLPDPSVLALRSRAEVNFPGIEALLGSIRVELLRGPLSRLLESKIKNVAAAAVLELLPNDIRTLVDFLDLTLKDYVLKSEERNRVLALLSKLTSSTQTFPQCYEVTGVKYQPVPIAEGGFGTVHRGSDLNMCVKVMSRVDTGALTEWIKELVLWSHSSHPNVLPFYGVFLENTGQSQRICLVSPFMKNGNLHDYAPRLPQKSRLPLILDVINGLGYLHVYGIIHSDLKGQNVLISDEGRGLLTDFGASQIVTATAAPTNSSIFSTLRFAAPELMEDGARPSKESDVWAFGCLCYQALSRKSPYYQYSRDFQVVGALSRKELPKRPSLAEVNDDDDENNWDLEVDDDWDPVDDQMWTLITKCCVPEPEGRLKIPAVQELIADMKVWDDRPAMRAVPGADIFKLRFKPDINLDHVGEILDKLQAKVAPSNSRMLGFIGFFNEMMK